MFGTLHPHTLAEVKLTLVWTDPPASVFSSSVMVNDIDLEVALGDTLFFPNKFGCRLPLSVA